MNVACEADGQGLSPGTSHSGRDGTDWLPDLRQRSRSGPLKGLGHSLDSADSEGIRLHQGHAKPLVTSVAAGVTSMDQPTSRQERASGATAHTPALPAQDPVMPTTHN